MALNSGYLGYVRGLGGVEDGILKGILYQRGALGVRFRDIEIHQGSPIYKGSCNPRTKECSS